MKKLQFVIVSLFLISFNKANDGTDNGKKLFIANCSMCHNPIKPAVGPPFQLIRKDYNIDWIYSMIRNHDSCITSQDIKSRYLYLVWNKACINNTYHFLSNKDINDILDFVDSTKPFNEQYYQHRKLTENEMRHIYAQYDSVLKMDGPFAAINFLDSLKNH